MGKSHRNLLFWDDELEAFSTDTDRTNPHHPYLYLWG